MPGHGAGLLVPLSSCTHPDSTRWFLHRKMPPRRYTFHGQEDCTRERAGPQKTLGKGSSQLQTPAQFRNSNISMHQPKENSLAPLTSSSALHSIQGEVPGLGGQLQLLSAEVRWRGGRLERILTGFLPLPRSQKASLIPTDGSAGPSKAAAPTRLPSCRSQSLDL